jgi:hypothetical protein
MTQAQQHCGGNMNAARILAAAAVIVLVPATARADGLATAPRPAAWSLVSATAQPPQDTIRRRRDSTQRDSTQRDSTKRDTMPKPKPPRGLLTPRGS